MKRMILLGTLVLALAPAPVFATQNSGSISTARGNVNKNDRAGHKGMSARAEALKKCNEDYKESVKKASVDYAAAVKDAKDKKGKERADAMKAASKAKTDAMAAARTAKADCMKAAPKK